MPSFDRKAFYNRSLERALKILCVFNADRQTLTLSQLSQILALSKATVLRLCSTLIKYGFLSYNHQSKQYSLGLKLFELGAIVFSSFSIRRVASPYLTQLQIQSGKAVFLGILQDDEIVYIDKKEDLRNPIWFGSQIGQHRPPHFGMLGQILLAFQPDTEVNRLLQKSPLTPPPTKKSITHEKEFKERLRKVSKQEFVVDEGEAIDGITGVAAPIRDFTNKVVAAIGVGFISSSEDSKGVKRILRDVRRTAQTISQELGYLRTRPVSVSGKGKKSQRPRGISPDRLRISQEKGEA
jgi:DNA-binding IclR family transcriptional regulator